MKKSSRVREHSETSYKWLEECKETDFDGHSAFSTFTPSQRLEWLAQAGDMVRALKGHSHLPPPS